MKTSRMMRLLSLVLSVAMIVAMLPVSALAADAATTETPSTATPAQDAKGKQDPTPTAKQDADGDKGGDPTPTAKPDGEEGTDPTPTPAQDADGDKDADPTATPEASTEPRLRGPLGAPQKKVTVTFKNGETGGTIKALTVNAGSQLKDSDYPDVPAVEGYDFKAWDPASPGRINADTTITATYQIKTYTVTFFDENGGELKKETVNHGSAATAPDVAKEGYTAHWDKAFSNITGALEVRLSYEINTYTVTFKNGVTGGTVKELTAEYGSSVSETDYPAAPANEGYDFKAWDKTAEQIGTVKADVTVTAAYQIKTYAVTFKDHDGKVLSTQTVEHGADAAAPARPSREGHTFTGWDGGYTNVKAETTVTALYEILTYTVLFRDWNGATLSTQTVAYGSAATAPEDPARADYTFAGWEPAVFTDITENLTVTARYTPVAAAPAEGQHSVTFKDWDGRVIDTQLVPDGESAAAPAAPERDGFKFTGWDADFSAVTADLTVRAAYEELFIFFVTVNYQYADGTIANEPFVSSYKKGDAVTDVVTSPVLRGFQANKAVVDFTNITAIDCDHTETVVYTPAAVGYTVRHMQQTLTGGWAEVEIDRKTGEGQTGQTVTERPNTYTGFTCTTGDKSLPLGADADGNVIEFRYERNSYLLIFDAAGGKYIAPREMLYGAPIGTETFPTPERAGWVFTAWSEAPAAMPAQDVTVTAGWEAGTAGYTVIYWLESPEGETAGGFSYIGAHAMTGTTGTTPTLPSASAYAPELGIDEKYVKSNTTNDLAGKTIAGDGSTIVNVYYYRKTVTLVFKLNGGNIGGSTTNPTIQNVRLGQSIASWPTAPAKTGTTFRCWLAGNSPYVTKQYYVDAVMFDNCNNITAQYDDDLYQYRITYAFESLDPATPGYELKDEFTAEVREVWVTGWTAKDFDGFEAVTREVNMQETNEVAKALGHTSGYCSKCGSSRDYNAHHYIYTAAFQYNRKAFDLTFYNGATMVGSASKVKYGADISGLAPAGYTVGQPVSTTGAFAGLLFDGWYEHTAKDAAGIPIGVGQPATLTTMPAKGLVLYAGYSKPSFTVTFDLNDAPETPATPASIDDATVTKGDTLAAPSPEPTRTGYSFLGWYSGGMRYIFNTEVHGDIDLTAQWALRTDVTYSVHYVFADGQDKTGDVFDPKTVSGKTTGESVLETARAYVADNGDLYLPNLGSATLTLLGDETHDVITFVYRKANSATFTVECRYNDGDKALMTEVAANPETITKRNIDAGFITWNAPLVPGYTPTKYQETVYYATVGTTIVFYYTKNTEVAYQVRYFFENLGAAGYTENTGMRDSGSGPIGSWAKKIAPDFTGFDYNAGASTESIRLGHDAQTNIIRLRYDRETYTVTYKVTGDHGHLELGGLSMASKVYSDIQYGTVWADANAAAPTPVADDGFKLAGTGWTPAFPADDTVFARDYTFEVSFETDPAQYYKVTYDRNSAQAPDAQGAMPVDDNGGNGYVKNSNYQVQDSGFTSVTYTFIGWNTAADGTGDAHLPGETFDITANMTLYAQWTAKAKFSVTYHGNEDGDGRPVAGAMAKQEKPIDQSIEISENGFANPGFTFKGWNTKADGSGTPYAAGADYSYDGEKVNLDLYAQWTKGARYTVEYFPNWPAGSLAADQSGAVPEDAKEYLAGEAVTAKGNTGLLAVKGYSFLGWAETADATAAGSSFAIAEDPDAENLKLYAVWQRQSYSVSFLVDYLDDKGYVAYTHEGLKTSYYYGETLVLADYPTAPTGHSFTGWQLQTGTALPTTMGEKDLVFQGTFEKNEYTLKYWVAEEGGKASADYGLNQTTTKEYGAPIGGANLPGYNGTIPAGYQLTGWYMDLPRTVPVAAEATMPAADEDLYAALLPRTDVKYTFEYYTQPVTNGVPTAETELDDWKLELSDVHNDGTTGKDVTAPQLAYTGYTFSAALSDTLTQKVAGDGSLVIRLYYTADKYAVTYTVTGAPQGVTAPVDGSSPYYEGAQVTVQAATVPDDYTFSGWSTGDVTGFTTESTGFTMPKKAVTLTGSYTEKPGAVRVEVYAQQLVDGQPVPDAQKATWTKISSDLHEGETAHTTYTVDPAALAPANHSFAADLSDSASAMVVAGKTVEIKLYYRLDKYTVRYEITGAPDGTAVPAEAEYCVGMTVTAATAAEVKGFTFAGWTNGNETVAEQATFTMGTEDVLLKGVYTQDEYTVSFEPGEHGDFAVKTATGLHYDDDMPAAPDTVSDDADYYFAGWALKDSTEIITLPAKVTGNATYVAQWLERGTITVTPGDLTLQYNGALRTIPAGSVTYTYDATLYRVSGATAEGTRTVVGVTPVTLNLDGLKVEKREGTAWTDVTADKDAYTLARGDNGALRIIPAPAVISVGNYDKDEGEADPVFTATVTGLYGNDTIAYTLTRAPGETAGRSYPIAIGYTPNRNYNVTLRHGLLSITAIPVPIPDDPIPLDGPELEPIDDEPTALAAPGNAWALLNLLLAIVSVLMSIFMLIGYIGKKQTADSEGVTRNIRKEGLARLVSLVPALGAVIAFLLTENMSNPMVFTDRWTLLMAVITLAQVLVAVMARKKEEEPQDGIDAI